MQLAFGPANSSVSSQAGSRKPKAIQALDTLRRVLGLPPLALPAPTKDPLKTSRAAAAEDLVQVATDAARPSRRRSPRPRSGP